MSSSPSLQLTARRLWRATVRSNGPAPVAFDSRAGALWTIVIALDFFLISNPLVLWPIESSIRFACGVTLLAVVFTPLRRIPHPPWSVIGMLGFGFLSSFWADHARTAFDFTMLYLVIALIALAIATTVDARTVAQGFLLGGVLIVAVSYYTLKNNYAGAAVEPGTNGYLAGVGTNRNILAYTLGVSLALAVGSLPRRGWARAAWALGVGIVLLGTYLAESGTGYVAAAVLIALAATLGALDRWHPPRPARSRARRWTVRALCLALMVGAVVSIDAIGRLMGRDIASLSGRVPVWEQTWQQTTGLDRWFGSGWGTVWPHPWHPAPFNADYADIASNAGVLLTHGHSSLFDLIPEVGLLGVLLMVAVYVQAGARAATLRNWAEGVDLSSRLEASRITLLGIVGLLLFGLTEPMSTIPLGWFTAATLAAGVIPRSGRKPPRARGSHRGDAAERPSRQPVTSGSPRPRRSPRSR